MIALRQEPVPIELVVEAKGETSERKGSQRYGKPFDRVQVKIHIAEAFYTAAALTFSPTPHPLRRVAVALPQNALHERYATRIQPAFTALGIGVFWMTPDKNVSLVAHGSYSGRDLCYNVRRLSINYPRLIIEPELDSFI